MPDGLNRPAGRVLMTTDAVGGVWRYTLDLARGFAVRGAQPLVAVLGPAPGAAQREEAMAAGVPVLETGLPLDWTATDAGALAEAAGQLRALASRAGVEAAHLHAPAFAGSERWTVPVVAVAHSCVATWWRAVRGGELPADFRWRTDAVAAGLRAADSVIAPTGAHAAALREAYGPIAVTVVHNGAAAEPGPAHDRAAHDRARVVLTAGRLWDEGKGAAVLDAAAPALDAPIRAAGPVAGPCGGAVALPNLRLLGTLDGPAMAEAYRRAQVFASPARYEPFGLSVLEAALAGCRLVLADIPSFRELWDGAATFVRGDADWLPALRDALDRPGDGGAAAWARRYTIERTVEGTLAVHRRVGVRV